MIWWAVGSDGPHTFTVFRPSFTLPEVWKFPSPALLLSRHRHRVGGSLCGGGTRNPGKMESSWVGCGSKYHLASVSHPWWSYPVAERAALGFIFWSPARYNIRRRTFTVLWSSGIKPPDGIKLLSYPQQPISWFTLIQTRAQVNWNAQFWFKPLESVATSCTVWFTVVHLLEGNRGAKML